jgi:hypothetical protein
MIQGSTFIEWAVQLVPEVVERLYYSFFFIVDFFSFPRFLERKRLRELGA